MVAIGMLAAMALAQADPGQANPAQHPQASGPTVVVTAPKSGAHPDATVEVDDEDVSDVYGVIWPAKAFDYHETGHVVLACRITPRGFAESCTVASETPPKMGFGDAALQLLPSLRLPPPKGLTGPGSVTKYIGINFTAPQDGLDGAASSGGSIGSISATTGRAMSLRSGNPMIMKPVTMMDHPVWVAAPSFEDVRRAYPASAGGGEGFAVLRCQVERDGALSRCDVSKELPDHRGFGRAALSLARLFRVAPDVRLRAPSRDPVQVVVPIRFAPPTDAPPLVTAPTWISGFNPDSAPKLFPAAAAAKGITTGRGVARCRIGADGMLTQCTPQQADPEGMGFSEAAVILAQTMKMSLWSAEAGPVLGGEIIIPIRLNLAAGPPR